MKEYKKPEVLMNEGLSEKVYMGSGSFDGEGDCWSTGVRTTQDWNGQGHVYEVSASHHKENVQHISTAVTYYFTFNYDLTNFWPENSGWASGFSGNTGWVERREHANAYLSGDEVTFKIFAVAADEATTKMLCDPAISWSCEKTVNVQGLGGDGN